MSDEAEGEFTRPSHCFEVAHRDVFAQEIEANDVDEIQEDGYRVDRDIDEVDEPLPPSVEDVPRWEAIVEDDGQVEAHHNGKVEPHAIEIELQGLAERQLVKKLLVEKIDHPTADAEGQKEGQEPVNKPHIRLSKPLLNLLFLGLSSHRLFLFPLQKYIKKCYFCPKFQLICFHDEETTFNLGFGFCFVGFLGCGPGVVSQLRQAS